MNTSRTRCKKFMTCKVVRAFKNRNFNQREKTFKTKHRSLETTL